MARPVRQRPAAPTAARTVATTLRPPRPGTRRAWLRGDRGHGDDRGYRDDVEDRGLRRTGYDVRGRRDPIGDAGPDGGAGYDGSGRWDAGYDDPRRPRPRPGVAPVAALATVPRRGRRYPTARSRSGTTGPGARARSGAASAAGGGPAWTGHPPAAPPGRAGRNLPAAIAVGVGLGAAILVPLFFYLPAFLAVVAAAVAIGIWEMARAVRRSGAHPPLVPLIAGGAITIGLAWFSGPDALSLGLLVTVLGTMVWRLGDGPGNYQRDLTAATLIAVYVPFLGGFAAMLAAAPGDGQLRVLVTLVAVVLSDTGGYAAGVAFGKHPMAPSISPKKSWEGFAGSVTAAAVGSALLIWLLFDVAPWWGALFGVAISVRGGPR